MEYISSRDKRNSFAMVHIWIMTDVKVRGQIQNMGLVCHMI